MDPWVIHMMDLFRILDPTGQFCDLGCLHLTSVSTHHHRVPGLVQREPVPPNGQHGPPSQWSAEGADVGHSQSPFHRGNLIGTTLKQCNYSITWPYIRTIEIKQIYSCNWSITTVYFPQISKLNKHGEKNIHYKKKSKNHFNKSLFGVCFLKFCLLKCLH